MPERLVNQIGFFSLIRETFKVSPDNKRVAFVVERDDKSSMLVDGNLGKPYDDIRGSPVFSPDSKRFSYIVKNSTPWHVVIDGEQGKGYDHIMGVHPIFSLDGQRVAFAAMKKDEIFVVEDGKEER